MGRLLVVVCVVTLGCGGSSQPGSDAAADAAEADAGPDAALDAAHWPSAAPADPVSIPCTGRLGFPGLPAVNTYSDDLRVADMNGDAIPDIVYRKYGFGIAHGNGDGTFATPVVAPTDSGVVTLAFHVAHMDGDGLLDVVTSIAVFTQSADMIRVYLNDGMGGFTAQQTHDIPDLVEQLDVADLNGDTRPDIVARHDQQISVLLSTSTGYSAAQVYDAGTMPFQIAVGDVTEDDVPDVVVTSAGAVSVLANTGTGVLAARVPHTLPASPGGVVLVDLNEDDRLDIAFGSSDANGTSVSVLLNLGAGGFGPAIAYLTGQDGASPPSLAVADIDGDGHLDLGTLSGVLLGDGAGQLVTSTAFGNARATGLAFGDLDADGRTDLVLRSTGAWISPVLNNGTASPFEMFEAHDFGVPLIRQVAARMTDLDSDGMLDLLKLGTHDGQPVVATRLATGGGSFAALTTTFELGLSPTPTVAEWSATNSTVLTDLDNDGRQDLLILGRSWPNIGVQAMLNNGDGTLSAAPVAAFGYGRSIAVGDFDGDGFRDLVIPDITPTSTLTQVRYLRGLGNGELAAAVSIWSGMHAGEVAALDVDDDDKLDLLIAGSVLIGQGDGTFAAPQPVFDAPFTDAQEVRDLDEDGDPDLVRLTYERVETVLNNGDGTFAPPLHLPTTMIMTPPAFADLDGDGHLDMVSAGGDMATVFLGRGDGTFDPPILYASGGYDTISTGDVDGDGRVDIMANGIYNDVTVLRGRCL